MKSILPIDKKLAENKRYYNKLFKTLKEYYKIESPADEIQLNLLVTDLLRLKEAYARIIKIDEKTNHEIVDIKRPKKSIGTKVLSDSSHSTTFNKIFNENIPHKTKIKLKANQSKLST